MVQSSNPKQKYHQQRVAGRERGKGEASLVDQKHKQKAPLLVTVSEGEATIDHVTAQDQSITQTSDHELVSLPHGLSEAGGSVHTPEVKLLELDVKSSSETKDSYYDGGSNLGEQVARLTLSEPVDANTVSEPLVSETSERTEIEHNEQEPPQALEASVQVPVYCGDMCCATSE